MQPSMQNSFIVKSQTQTLEFPVSMQLSRIKDTAYSLLILFSIYILSSWQVWCTGVGSYSTHLLPMCCWVTHTFFITKSNKYLFSPWQPTELLQQKEKQVRFHSASLIKRSPLLVACASTTNRVVETLECVQNRAMEIIMKGNLWVKVKVIHMDAEIKLCE